MLVGTFFLLQSSLQQTHTLNNNKEFDTVELGIRNCILGLPSVLPYRFAGTGAVWYTGTGGCDFGAYNSALTFTGVTI